MTDFQIFFIGLVVFTVGALIGCLIQDSYNPNSVTFEDCKEIKIDTVSHNYRDSTYVLQVDIKY